jgi:predicted GNAT family acetyltransferase
MRAAVRRHFNAVQFLRHAGGWLAAREAEHNLILSIAGNLTRSTPAEPPYLAAVEADGAVVGCAIRTPPHKLVLTRMPAAALAAAVLDVADIFPDLQQVHGPVEEARRFAEQWCARTGAVPRSGMLQGIYELDTVKAPEPRPPGEMRVATGADADLVTAWAEAFALETATDFGRARATVQVGIARRSIFLWDDDAPVSVAACVGETPTGRRIGLVYTPPEARGRGYAGACVADLSQRVLDAGARFCFLYTDMANRTSNGLYQRIGYRRIADAIDYHLS